MIIRPMLFDDLPAVMVAEQTIPGAWTIGQWNAEINYPYALRLVAEENEQVTGFAVFRVLALEAELLRLAVLPASRRRGIAVALLNEAFAALLNQGVATCFLEVRCSNQAARSLYAKLEFQEVGLRKNYYQQPSEDAVLMQKDITS